MSISAGRAIEKGQYDPLSLDSDDTSSHDNEQDTFLPNNATRGRRPQQQLRVSQVFVVTTIALVAGVLLGFFATRWTTPDTRSLDAAQVLRNIGINPSNPIPKEVLMKRKDVAFIPHREYMGPSEEAARNWKHLTAGSDSVYLPNPARHGLHDPGIRAPFFIFNEPPPAALEDKSNLLNFYVLNNLHQLHCVHMIRMRYNSLVYEAATTTPLAQTPLDKDWIDHVEHCFEYLRLSVTCGDYMTFESDSPPGSPREYWEDGLSWGVVHSCIDWDGLMGWQEDMVGRYNQTWQQ